MNAVPIQEDNKCPSENLSGVNLLVSTVCAKLKNTVIAGQPKTLRQTEADWGRLRQAKQGKLRPRRGSRVLSDDLECVFRKKKIKKLAQKISCKAKLGHDTKLLRQTKAG